MNAGYHPAYYLLVIALVISLLMVMGSFLMEYMFRHEKLGKLQIKTELSLEKKNSIKIQVFLFLFFVGGLIIIYFIGRNLVPIGNNRSIEGLWNDIRILSSNLNRMKPTIFNYCAVGSLFAVWCSSRQNEIRSKGILLNASPILWNDIREYRWDDAGDKVFFRIDRKRGWKGHKGGVLQMSIFEDDREEVARYLEIYLPEKQRGDRS